MRYPLAMLMTALTLSGPVLAADEERAACMTLSGDERKTCLREVGAARVEAKRGGLSDSAGYEKNLTARCNYLPAGDREDCMRRMRGEGTVTGSVEGGGIYRELRTIVPAPDEGAGSGATK
jgi:hypothetical protein